MTLSRPYRPLALPALAILVSMVFVAVLGSKWLAVEREAARLRGTEAATAALGELRQNLIAVLAQSALDLLPQLRTNRHATRDSARALPPIVAEAFLVDGTGRLPRPLQGSADNSPAALQERAAALLASGARAIAGSRLDEADESASRLLECCAGVRDEFGIAYGVYASWQRLTIDSRLPDRSRPVAIVRVLRSAIDAGKLAEASDVVGLRMLAEKLADVPGAAALTPLVERAATETAGRQQAARAAEGWLRSLNWDAESSDSPVRIGRWTTATPATLAAAWRLEPSETVVIRLDADALEAFVSRWSASGSPFLFAVDSAPPASPLADAVLRAPLFTEAPAVSVTVRRSPDNSATDRRREQLFMTSAVAVLALTLVAGYFAARDVFRELRMASMRSTFLAGVTHEIKTPLTSIRLLAETLQQQRVSPAESQELLTTIVNEAEHLSGLVDNVLGTSRIETGRRTYQMNPVSLGEVVRGAHRRFHYTLTKEGFTLVESIDPAPIWVRADAEALAQAVLNLLANATKYSGASREIRLSVTATDRHGLVRVADDGIGVAPREQARIFKSFYRGRRTAEATTGTGLGLALVKHFAGAHHGSITLESEPGRGSTFTLSLPLIPAPREQESANG